MDRLDPSLVGARAEVTRVVGVGDTASALGSGSLSVLGTPRLLAWCEAATCDALAPLLAAGTTSVGTSVRLDHVAPSSVGERLTVRAEVSAVTGRSVVLEVEATDAGARVVARGTVERAVVDERRFLDRLAGGGRS